MDQRLALGACAPQITPPRPPPQPTNPPKPSSDLAPAQKPSGWWLAGQIPYALPTREDEGEDSAQGASLVP